MRTWWHVHGGVLRAPDGTPAGYTQSVSTGVPDPPGGSRVSNDGDGRPVMSPVGVVVEQWGDG